MSSPSKRVVIGMDPHKRSATVEITSANETIHGGSRFGTDRDGYAAMLRYARHSPDRVWAIEGCAGIGKHIANRLLADGEQVVDVPPKLSAAATSVTVQPGAVAVTAMPSGPSARASRGCRPLARGWAGTPRRFRRKLKQTA